jgi:K+-sensing histidine kinase KdpD
VRGQSSFTEKYFEGISHRLDQAMERRNAQLNDQVHYFISSLRSDLETNRTLELPSLSSEEPRSIVARQNIVREISHALYTPLSRIDAIASNVTAESPNRTIIEKMEKAKSAVEICYAYLAGYRNVINVTEKTSYWTPQSLKKAIQASSEVFIDATSKKPQIQIRAPESVRSVSNIFMLAVLLPLIENAVEASQNDDVINIDVHDVGGRVFASVTNPLHEEFPGDQVLTAGFTTKNISEKARNSKSHEGLGLTIVQNLLSAIPQSHLNFEVSEGSVTFTVSMPSRG